jgi:hypothetical protein
MGKTQHVVMHDDRWAVKEEGASAPVATFKTQGQAWEKAKAIRKPCSTARTAASASATRTATDPRSTKG